MLWGGGDIPGRRIIWVVAPALRIAVTAAWTEVAHEPRPGTFSTVATSVSWPWHKSKEIHTVMRLIHQSHNHVRLIFILPRQLCPQARKVTRRGPARSPNDFSIPPRVIMDIDDAMRARLQARLHQLVVLAKLGLVKSTAEDVVNEVLPGNGQAKDIESVVFGKVRHLGGTVVTIVFGERGDHGG